MSSDAKKLKQFIAQRTVEITKLSELLKVAEQSLQDRQYHSNFKCRYKHIEAIYESFSKIHNNIILITSAQEGGDVESHNTILTEFENHYYHIQAIYTNLFDDNRDNNNPNANGTMQSQRNNVKLPKIELPIFDGNVKLWQTYIDMYDSLINNNDALSKIEKFNYLLSSLKGAPLALVKCTPLTGQNYIVAYNALKKRYDNKRLIATTHWHAIEATKKISNAENSFALRNLIDTFTENISVLENIGYPVKQWDFILFNMLIDRLDTATATRFELEYTLEIEKPESLNKTFDTLKDFLNKQCIALENVSVSNNKQKSSDSEHKTKSSQLYQKGYSKLKPISSFMANVKQNLTCQLCTKDHLIYNCPNFLSKSTNERYSLIKDKKWCTNCLGSRHSSINCTSRSSCKTCSRRHHTLLHFDASASSQLSDTTSQMPQISAPSTSSNTPASTNLFSDLQTTVLLSTALIEVRDTWGNYQRVRVVLDSASQSNFISNKCCSRLGLSRFPLSLDIKGIGQINSRASQGVTCSIKPLDKNEPIFSLDFIILPQVCNNLPCTTIAKNKFTQFSNLKLADPNFNVSSEVDMLLGADIFGFLLKGSSISTAVNEPIALDTVFGWIVMGKVNNSLDSSANSFFVTNCFFSSLGCTLEDSIKRFWELEVVPAAPKLSTDDLLAEKIYCDTLSQAQSGRYIVSLPFREGEPIFEGSRDISLRRFFLLERRLLKIPALYSQYCDFMQDYLSSNHMENLSDVSVNSQSYYLPHHCVVKPDSFTTKLRVVFDASARDLNNKSLNDTLLIGPKLQQDVVSILLKFRLYSVVFTADIKQMYRQILMSDKHRDYQRILWRFSPSDPIQDFRLNTVVYGVNSSPFLAIRTILQLAHDNEALYPEAAKLLETDMYVDDIVSGCDSVTSALNLQKNLIALLHKGGFELRKWASNHPALLTHLSSSELQIDPLSFDLENNSSIKILGLHWNFSNDIFSYNVTPQHKPCTKRSILSELAKVFDPLGFLLPLTLSLKLLIQSLWSSGINWDDPAPQKVCNLWQRFNSELPSISTVKIPRRITVDNFISCQLHGFSDASEKAYAAVVYLRLFCENNIIKTYFVCAKSKVAPLKRITLPRLELCAALLLANLLQFVQEAYSGKLLFSQIFAWTDSTIVLHWLNSEPHKWTTFVCNRVTQIHEKLPSVHWRYVSSRDNPADPPSRGLLPCELLNNAVWWAGPSWLNNTCENWPSNEIIFPETHEEQRKITLSIITDVSIINALLDHFSSLLKIQRIVCYILRFIHNSKFPTSRKTNTFSLFDMDEALCLLIKFTQHEAFSHEISLLNSNKPLPKHFKKLSPFLDNQGILRVGGRLTQSKLAYEQKHPALLPSKHRLTWLIIDHTHRLYLHPGIQTLRYFLSQRYWILAPYRTIRKVISQCHKCFRVNPVSAQPLMGNLPHARISQIKPFSEVGVDYGGPFLITMSKTRGAKTLKAYICLFVCMATKAIHLELVSELSTEAFLAALRRFIARRGRCNHIYSDCGANFVGASKELNKTMHHVSKQESIQWHFNPPFAPNFGGLWEAGIKSVKSHLSRVIGAQILTYEEFNTVLTQIEAVLNSRPLCPQSSDPNDLSVLTPGHFLTLEPLNAPPEDNLGDIKIGRLTRWQLLQRLHQDFWSRWHREYLHTLLQRSKWTDSAVPVLPNTLVLLKDEHSPPLKWNLGRVIDTHPGSDNIVRVVTVKTSKGIFKRPVTKVCPLPFN